MNDNPKEPFAVVPQSLLASKCIEPTDKLILSVCIGTDNIKLKDGRPYTHSVASLVKATGLNERTVRREIKRLKELHIFKLYGWLKNKKKKYPIYVFQFNTLKTVISTADKMTVEKVNEYNTEMDNDSLTADTTADTDGHIEVTCIKETSVAVAVPNTATATTESFDKKIAEGISVPLAYSDTLDNRTATTEIINKETSSDVMFFEPYSEVRPLKVPASIGISPCAKRQDYIVKTFNSKYHQRFFKEGPMGSELMGYNVCAYDSKDKLVLVTCDNVEYLITKPFQKLCNHFYNKDYSVCAWIGETECVVIQPKEGQGYYLCMDKGQALFLKQKDTDKENALPTVLKKPIEGSGSGVNVVKSMVYKPMHSKNYPQPTNLTQSDFDSIIKGKPSMKSLLDVYDQYSNQTEIGIDVSKAQPVW